jgi:ferredoxin--NADP+ reductase
VELLGNGHVEGMVLRRQRPGTEPVTETLDVQLVLRAIGYQAKPLPELPFDEIGFVVPNVAGRVVDADGVVLPGEYVAGWCKRGPSGVIGTNRGDATETVRSLAADLATLPERKVTDPEGIRALLAERGVRYVDWAAWQRLELHEKTLGSARGTATVKVSDRAAMLEICGP